MIISCLLITVIEIVFTKLACNMLMIENVYINFVCKMVICVLIPNSINIGLFWNQKDFQRLVQRGKELVKKEKGDV